MGPPGSIFPSRRRFLPGEPLLERFPFFPRKVPPWGTLPGWPGHLQERPGPLQGRFGPLQEGFFLAQGKFPGNPSRKSFFSLSRRASSLGNPSRKGFSFSRKVPFWGTPPGRLFSFSRKVPSWRTPPGRVFSFLEEGSFLGNPSRKGFFFF